LFHVVIVFYQNLMANWVRVFHNVANAIKLSRSDKPFEVAGRRRWRALWEMCDLAGFAPGGYIISNSCQCIGLSPFPDAARKHRISFANQQNPSATTVGRPEKSGALTNDEFAKEISKILSN